MRKIHATLRTGTMLGTAMRLRQHCETERAAGAKAEKPALLLRGAAPSSLLLESMPVRARATLTRVFRGQSSRSRRALSLLRDMRRASSSPPFRAHLRVLGLAAVSVASSVGSLVPYNRLYALDRRCGDLVTLCDCVMGCLANCRALLAPRRAPMRWHVALAALSAPTPHSAALYQLPMTVCVTLKNGSLAASMAIGALALRKRYSRQQCLAVVLVRGRCRDSAAARTARPRPAAPRHAAAAGLGDYRARSHGARLGARGHRRGAGGCLRLHPATGAGLCSGAAPRPARARPRGARRSRGRARGRIGRARRARRARRGERRRRAATARAAVALVGVAGSPRPLGPFGARFAGLCVTARVPRARRRRARAAAARGAPPRPRARARRGRRPRSPRRERRRRADAKPTSARPSPGPAPSPRRRLVRPPSRRARKGRRHHRSAPPPVDHRHAPTRARAGLRLAKPSLTQGRRGF